MGLAETSALTAPPKSVRPLAGPGKPLALRLPTTHQATAPVSPRPPEVRTAGPHARSRASKISLTRTPRFRRMRDMPNYARKLRQALIERAEKYVCKHHLTEHVYRSRGNPPTVLFRPYRSNGQDYHGNFILSSYKAIMEKPEWRARLERPHQRQNALRPEDRAAAKELDSCCSSDALLMNIFCHPTTEENLKLAALLGLKRLPTPEFGFRARLPFGEARYDRTQLDVRLFSSEPGQTTILEAKLTEPGITKQNRAHVHRYRDFAEVFNPSLLPHVNDEYLHYQLLRNVLAATHLKGRFILLYDERRPDLGAAFREVSTAIRCPDLQSRCSLVTWQKIATTLPKELQSFLAEKYGIQ